MYAYNVCIKDLYVCIRYMYVYIKCMHKRYVYMHVQNNIEQMYELTVQHECIQRMYRRSL
jgi:hypothetical protein